MGGCFTGFAMEKAKCKKFKVCVIVSSPMTVVAFLRDQLRELGSQHDLHVVANAPDGGFLSELGVSATFIPVSIERKIRPLADMLSLSKILWLLRRERFDMVYSVTPKAGLLAMVSAFFASVPVRIHTFTGQVWATKTGFPRRILRLADTLLAACATHVLVDSSSQREFLLDNRVVTAKKSKVLGRGSISGVDRQRFHPDQEARNRLRLQWGIPSSDVVFVYVGRLNRDKGIPELIQAFEEVLERASRSWLLVVGPDEEDLEGLIHRSSARSRIIREGYTSTPEKYMAAADVFVLPSHREGFGSTVIEAAATGIPAIASRVYGLIDAVIDEETGVLHAPGDTDELAEAMVRLASDQNVRQTMGEAAKLRAESDFSKEIVTANALGYYEKVLRSSEQ
jgi:glycosyltransferase involved in cell wall biosynthesis